MTHPGFMSDEAMARYRHLQPHIEDDIPLAQLVEASDMSERTLRRWLSAYRRNGIEGLARQPRNDRGKRRMLSSNLEKMIRVQASKRPRPPLTVIHRRIAAAAKEKGIPAPSYGMVVDVARQISPAAIALASGNAAEFRDKHEIVHRREATAPNEMWQADHTLLDIHLLDERGEVCRPWLSLVVDDYSRAIAGYFLTSGAPSAINTALALRQAIWRKENSDWPICGIPQILYVDNGSDFISEHIEQACIALKIRLIHSMPGRPRGRGRVERLFRTVNDMLLAELPGFLKNGKPQLRPALTVPEFTARFEDFLHGIYHQREHGTIGEPPIKRWLDGGFLPQMPETIQALDMLLLSVAKLRKVQRDGIRFQGKRYVEPTLSAFVGESVEVLYDPRDLAEVQVYHDGQFICRALCPEHVSTPSLGDIVSARRKQRKDAKEEAGLTSDKPSKPRKRRSGLKLYVHDD